MWCAREANPQVSWLVSNRISPCFGGLGPADTDHGGEVLYAQRARAPKAINLTDVPSMLSILLTTLVSLASLAAALEVSVDSPCAPKCIDDPAHGNASDPMASLTFNSNLFCYDWEVEGANSTDVGRKFKDCNNCLKDSGFVKESADERDITWFMCTSTFLGDDDLTRLTVRVVNNRGVVDWCLFGRFAEESNPNISTTRVYTSCHSHCSGLYNAADYTIKSNLDSYSFCTQDGDFGANAESCLACLYDTPGLNMLGNGTLSNSSCVMFMWSAANE
jgi:hypothetical protein